MQASIAQVRFYQRGNIGRDSTKKMHFGVASALVCSHLATQTSHGTSEINHDTRVFNPLAFGTTSGVLLLPLLPDM